MDFENIPNNQKIKKYLDKTILENRIPHAILFSGKKGCGMLVSAIYYAKKILLKTDESSTVFDRLEHPDLHFIFPTNTNSEIKKNPTSDLFIKSFRQFVLQNPYSNENDWYNFINIEKKQGVINKNDAENLIKKIYVKSYTSDYKVVIIWVADKMNSSTSNKLLKLIEEPPDKTVFILITNDEKNMIKTIKSRTQIIDFNKFPSKEIEKYLVEEKQLDSLKAKEIARKSNGDLSKAINYIKEEENEFEKIFVNWMRNAFKAKKNPNILGDLIEISEELNSFGREKQKQFLKYSLEIFRQAMIYNYDMEQINYVNFDENFNFKAFSKYIKGDNIEQILSQINEAFYHIERNVNGKIVFFDLSIKITRLLHL